MAAAHSLYTHPIHLGLGATATAQPEFTGMEWYDAHSERHAVDGREGRRVSLYRVVACLEGAMTLHQELPDGTRTTVELGPGDYAINPAGAWHTADIDGSALALFITPGEGTENRPR